MFDFYGCGRTRSRDGVNRRDFIRAGGLGMMGLSLADGFALKTAGAIAAPSGVARAVIQLWMNGGPAQTDTFDPKPEAGAEITGPFRRPIETSVKGIRIGALLPLMARQADKYAIIRSMTHTNKGHETATYMMMTGTPAASDLPYPALGAVVALKKNEAGYRGALPPYITLTHSLGRLSEAGFLGDRYRAFAPGGDPNDKGFSVPGDAKKAFDISREKDSLRDQYGRHHFGQSCLMARRLVEHGVPFVTVNMGGWDTHVENFKAMKNLLPVLDSGFSTLLQDLADRGLLESTIVVWHGEFGRTPRVAGEPPWFGGRHHFGNVFSAVVAGGGFKGGQVIGASDGTGENVKERPVYPWDLSASIYKLLGIDPNGRLPHPQGCAACVSPLASGQVRSGGLLAEIMPSAAATAVKTIAG